MPEGEKYSDPIMIREGTFGPFGKPSLYARTCLRCGALVMSTPTDDEDPSDLHDRFHDGLAQTAATAREAETWAGMLRPLGGLP